ncbi:MAG: hypothetical protein AB1921_19905 [Thermodesulfobacteriota bacterium]
MPPEPPDLLVCMGRPSRRLRGLPLHGYMGVVGMEGIIALGKILACAVFLMTVLGCAIVYQIPPSLTPQQRAELRSSPCAQLVVGIANNPGGDDGKHPSEHAIEQLKNLFTKTGLFKRVELTGALETPPDLVVNLRSGPPPVLCATPEACTMIMTLGVVPLPAGRNVKYAFTITDPTNSKALDLEFTCIEKAYFGSVSTLKILSPNWSTSSKRERNYELFAYELVSKKDEILGLGKDGSAR